VEPLAKGDREGTGDPDGSTELPEVGVGSAVVGGVATGVFAGVVGFADGVAPEVGLDVGRGGREVGAGETAAMMLDGLGLAADPASPDGRSRKYQPPAATTSATTTTSAIIVNGVGPPADSGAAMGGKPPGGPCPCRPYQGGGAP